MAPFPSLRLQDELLVHSAVRHEVCALLITKWLHDALDKLTADQRITHAKAICNASDARDRAVKALGLDQHEIDASRTLYASLDVPDDPKSDSQPAQDGEHGGP